MEKVYRRENGEYTFDEYTDGIMNKNIVPPKYSPQDKYGEQRRKALKSDE